MCMVFLSAPGMWVFVVFLTHHFNRLRSHVQCRQLLDKEKQKSTSIEFHFKVLTKKNEVLTIKVSLCLLESIIER